MTRLPIYHVDAFADAVFEGNPAAVCPLPAWLTDESLLSIAAENNLSETAFFVWPSQPVPLRWFTPRAEVPLCGHATLASGFVVLTFLAPDAAGVTFTSQSGPLTVRRTDEGLAMDLPAVAAPPADAVPAALRQALGVPFVDVRITPADPNYLVIVDDEEAVAAVAPDLRLLERLHPHGVAVSAPGRAVDFVSRYFAPSYGIPEDPVTGSIHCALAPYWAERLGKTTLTAVQRSSRQGRLTIDVAADRVVLHGNATCYLKGEIYVPTNPLP